MFSINKKIISIIILAAVASLAGLAYLSFKSPWKFRAGGPIKIFVLNSYTPSYPGISEQIDGFKNLLKEKKINYTIKQFDLDFINQTTEEAKQAKAQEALKIIEEYNPDLVYALAESAKKYVGDQYANSDLPWVFSDMNSLNKYAGIKNFAALIDLIDFPAYINFWKSSLPGVKKIAFALERNDDLQTAIEAAKLDENIFNQSGLELVGLEPIATFAEFKNRVLDYQNKADVLVIGYLEGFLDENDQVTPSQEVLKWLLANNKIPEFTPEPILVSQGVLSSLSASHYEEGQEAAKIVYEILIKGSSPQDQIIKITHVNKYFNVKRISMLGLEIPSLALINALISEEFLGE